MLVRRKAAKRNQGGFSREQIPERGYGQKKATKSIEGAASKSPKGDVVKRKPPGDEGVASKSPIGGKTVLRCLIFVQAAW